VKFADDLKQMASNIWGFSLEDMESFEAKERLLDSPINMDDYLPQMIKATGLNIEPRNKLAHSLREILQFFGTEYVRSISDSYWVDRTISKIKNIGNRVLVTDCRFSNEAAAIKDIGGSIIRVMRIHRVQEKKTHASEIEIDKIYSDLMLGVPEGDISILKRASYFLAFGKPDQAFKYDYNVLLSIFDKYSSGWLISDCVREWGFKNSSRHTTIFTNMLQYYKIPIRHVIRDNEKLKHTNIDGVELKECSKCHELCSTSNFGFSVRSIDLLSSQCKTCRNCSTSYLKYSKIDNLEKIYKSYKKNAKSRNLDFSISLEDLNELMTNQMGVCYYSGIPMTFSVKDPNKLSIDRIDSNLGYFKENIVLCCSAINLMKRHWSSDYFFQLINRIYKHSIEKAKLNEKA
jgi:hypothetical protein